MVLILDTIWLLLISGVLALIVLGLLSPFESLAWWAGWSPRQNSLSRRLKSQTEQQDVATIQPDHYVVYLSGIGDISGDWLSDKEVHFLADLRAQVPGVVVIDDVFPYSVTNLALTGQRTFARLWRWIQQVYQRDPDNLLAYLINLRNVFQVMVSADNRYGPIYSFGMAEVIAAGLLRHGYDLDNPRPITLIGYSGGGQISLGATTYLASTLHVPIQIISIGGVMCSDPGCNYMTHMHHLRGEQDSTERLGALVFPSRWPITRLSAWNKAKAEGKITLHRTGKMGHTGEAGYFGPEHRAVTVELVARLIASTTPQPQPQAAPQPA